MQRGGEGKERGEKMWNEALYFKKKPTFDFAWFAMSLGFLMIIIS